MKKVFLMYSVGFVSAFVLPKRYFFDIMRREHEMINDNIVVRERERYIRID
jgi:hypothetical protein